MKRPPADIHPSDPRKLLRQSADFSTHNRFNVLQQDIEQNEQHSEKEEKPPPIYVKNITNYQTFVTSLKTIANDIDFTCKSTVDTIIIYPSTSELYRKFVPIFKSEKLQFHTYQLPEDRPHRVVLRGLHYSTPTELIKNELLKIGFSIRAVTNVISRHKLPLPLFFLDLEAKSTNIDSIYKLDRLLHSVISIEELRRHRNTVQCTRCQKFNHTKTYCNYNPRCVKCAGDHLSSDCNKTRETPPKCALCLQEHVASYRGCSVFQELQKNRHGNRRQTRHSPQESTTNITPIARLDDENVFPALQRTPSTNRNNVNMEQSVPATSNRTAQFQRHSKFEHSSYSSRVRGDHCSTGTQDNVSSMSHLMSNFLTEIKNLIMPMMTLMTQLAQALLTRHAP